MSAEASCSFKLLSVTRYLSSAVAVLVSLSDHVWFRRGMRTVVQKIPKDTEYCVP